jgi:hypothetical protein
MSSYIRGPRFALKSTENVRACIKCVYGNGEHAKWCEKAGRLLPDAPRLQGGTRPTELKGDK